MPHPRPIVLVSRCLGFDRCRYNGQTIPDRFVEKLGAFVEYRHTCPEVAIGLGVPRPPIRIVDDGSGRRLVQPETGRDCTGAMNDFCAGFLDELGPVDGAILKYRSPSCGLKGVKVFPGADSKQAGKRGPGFFGAAVLERLAGRPVEDEGRLQNYNLRENFLLALFTHARFRAAQASGEMSALVAFHARHKYLLMAYHQEGMRKLGRIVANPKHRAPDRVFGAYARELGPLLSRQPRREAKLNVLQHLLGHYKKDLAAEEKAFFLETLDRYRGEKAPFSVPLHIIRAWLARRDSPYLREQVLFDPYPEALADTLDSGKGRDV
ncbi:MAG: YbgA family protein [Planctomycetota bacterium]